MTLRQLRTLVAITQEGSFAAAGNRLGLTQAAVSTQIRLLEEKLGATLFDRIGRRQVLNHDGRLVLQRAKDILELFDQLGEGIGEEGQFHGELLLGAVFSVQTGPLGQLLARLREHFPDLKIKVFRGMSIDLAERVENGELDAVLITQPQRPISPEYAFVTLESEPFYLIVHRQHSAVSDEDILVQEPFIRVDPNAWAGTMIDNELRQRGIVPNEMMELDSWEAALVMVEQKLGFTIMPLGKQRVAQLSQQFRLIPFGNPPITRNMGVYQKQKHSRARLIDTLISEYQAI